MSKPTEEKKEGLKEVPFRENLWSDGPDGAPELMATKCKACGNVFFPSVKVCYQCISDKNLEETRLKVKGKLYAYTVVKRGLPGYATPYYLGSIDLEKGPRVLFQLAECTLEQLHTGMEMEAYIGTVRTEEDGTRKTGPLFRPAKKS